MTALILSRQRRAKIKRTVTDFKGSAGATHREDDRYGGPVQAETMLDWWTSRKGWRVLEAAVFLRANLSKWDSFLEGP